MKRQQVLFIAVCAFVVGGIILYWMLRGPVAQSHLPSASSTPTLVVATSATPPLAKSPTPKPRTPERFNEQVQGAAIKLNQPLRFWGKVVDQQGNSLGGVEVSYKTRSVHSPMFAAIGTKENYGKTVTKDDGAFFIDAGRGDMLGLYEVRKPGYRLAENTKTGFAYAGSPEIHRPDSESPVVFVMYEQGAVEALRHYEHRFDLPPDGRSVGIDLTTGSVSEAGALRVTLSREPVNIQRGRPFLWSAKVEMTGGGLVRADESKPFIAPEQGYETSLEYAFRPKKLDWDADWQGSIQQMIYVRTADGTYGRVRLELDARSQPPPCALFVEVWLNPKPGSRILEYEPSKQAPAGPGRR